MATHKEEEGDDADAILALARLLIEQADPSDDVATFLDPP
jgi:hypothetical protein